MGLLNVIKFLNSGYSRHWSYPVNRSIILYTANPVKDSVKCLMNGGVDESWIVTALRSWGSWMRHSDLPSCLSTQNQWE